jgi:hypothetical protein
MLHNSENNSLVPPSVFMGTKESYLKNLETIQEKENEILTINWDLKLLEAQKMIQEMKLEYLKNTSEHSINKMSSSDI